MDYLHEMASGPKEIIDGTVDGEKVLDLLGGSKIFCDFCCRSKTVAAVLLPVHDAALNPP